jgi:hypothetical protein
MSSKHEVSEECIKIFVGKFQRGKNTAEERVLETDGEMEYDLVDWIDMA